VNQKEEKGKCEHSIGVPGMQIDCVNPYSGKCCKCGEQVIPEDKTAVASWCRQDELHATKTEAARRRAGG
jgi:hypothetical protein